MGQTPSRTVSQDNKDKALHTDALNGDIISFKHHIQNGANIYSYGNMALSNAVLNNNVDIIKYILDIGDPIKFQQSLDDMLNGFNGFNGPNGPNDPNGLDLDKISYIDHMICIAINHQASDSTQMLMQYKSI